MLTTATTKVRVRLASTLLNLPCALLLLAACSSDTPGTTSACASDVTSTTTSPAAPAPTASTLTAAPAEIDPASSPNGGGPVVFVWRTSGDAQHRFNRPTTMVTDKNCDLYIVDGTNHRVQKFSGNGTFLTTWGS
jgi:NHL repeat